MVITRLEDGIKKKITKYLWNFRTIVIYNT